MQSNSSQFVPVTHGVVSPAQDIQNNFISEQQRVAGESRCRMHPRNAPAGKYNFRNYFSNVTIENQSDSASHGTDDKNKILEREAILKKEYRFYSREIKYLNKEIESYKKDGEECRHLDIEKSEAIQKLDKCTTELVKLREQIKSWETRVAKPKSKSFSTTVSKSVKFDKSVEDALEKRINDLCNQYKEFIVLKQMAEEKSSAPLKIFEKVENLLKKSRISLDQDELEMLKEELINMIEREGKNSDTLDEIIQEINDRITDYKDNLNVS